MKKMNKPTKTTLKHLALSSAYLLVSACFSPLSAQPADTVYFGGDIITMKGTTPQNVEALAIRAGRIIFAGKMSEARPLLRAKSRRINLAGKTLLPGFIDGHSHLLSHADSYTQAPLSPPPMGSINSIPDIVQKLNEFKRQ